MTIELPDALGKRLADLADRWGQTPDELAAWFLVEEIDRIDENRQSPDFQARAAEVKTRMEDAARQVARERAGA